MKRLLAIEGQGFAKLRLQNPAAAVKVAGRQLEPQVAVHRWKATAKKPPQAERAGAAIPACKNNAENPKDGHRKTMQPGQTAESSRERAAGGGSDRPQQHGETAAWTAGVTVKATFKLPANEGKQAM